MKTVDCDVFLLSFFSVHLFDTLKATYKNAKRSNYSFEPVFSSPPGVMIVCWIYWLPSVAIWKANQYEYTVVCFCSLFCAHLHVCFECHGFVRTKSVQEIVNFDYDHRFAETRFLIPSEKIGDPVLWIAVARTKCWTKLRQKWFEDLTITFFSREDMNRRSNPRQEVKYITMCVPEQQMILNYKAMHHANSVRV